MMFSICSAQTNGGMIPDLIILSDIFPLIATDLSFNPDSVFQFKLGKRFEFASIQHNFPNWTKSLFWLFSWIEASNKSGKVRPKFPKGWWRRVVYWRNSQKCRWIQIWHVYNLWNCKAEGKYHPSSFAQNMPLIRLLLHHPKICRDNFESWTHSPKRDRKNKKYWNHRYRKDQFSFTLGKGSGELLQQRMGSSGVSKDLLLAIGRGTCSLV